ncbi:MAG: GerAB/ArcD/ProY family transporter [Ruminococcus sp.]|nr:GerAB/ArcD/ProY family transporter [Ruminococcus sp.]MCM1382017.1 GerAB/ArcD/ProY family transporter [Muribaculaceae bacterium]MCM1478523.1 GerAB/ArcD/ProY family transporter [Muribaculaceae bacterium]
MGKNQKIGWGQFLLLLFMCRVFTLMTFVPMAGGGNLSVQTTAAVISTVVQAVLLIPIVLLKNSVTETALAKNRACGVVTAAVYLLFFLFYAVNSLMHFQKFLSARFFRDSGEIVMLAVLLAVCVYCACLGVEALGRGGVLLFWLFLAALIIMALYSAGDFDVTNLIFGSVGEDSLVNAVMDDLARNGEICAAAFLAKHVRDKLRCGVYGLLASKLLLTEAVILLITAVLGDFARLTDYPFLTVGTFGGAGFIQRGDALYLIVWTVTAVVNISLFLHISAGLMTEVFPKIKFSTTIAAAVVFAAAAAMTVTGMELSERNFRVLSGCSVIILTGVIPLIWYLITKKRGAKSA